MRSNEIRAIVTTSALEVSIDMPDLNWGINPGLPLTRNQCHRRLGRVGRARPARFIVFGDPNLFRSQSETLADHHKSGVEESRLFLDTKTLVFHPARALANDQLIRWQQSADLVGLPLGAIRYISGDAPMKLRDQDLGQASIALMTPTVRTPG